MHQATNSVSVSIARSSDTTAIDTYARKPVMVSSSMYFMQPPGTLLSSTSALSALSNDDMIHVQADKPYPVDTFINKRACVCARARSPLLVVYTQAGDADMQYTDMCLQTNDASFRLHTTVVAAHSLSMRAILRQQMVGCVPGA